MATGERINYFRNLRGLTQKYLGQKIGFPDSSADVRIAQYESETRHPKVDVIKKLAKVLDVKPSAIEVPNIDTEIGLMHTVFALEDRYGLKICKIDDELYLKLERKDNRTFNNMFSLLNDWNDQASQLAEKKITVEEYNHWRYHYPDMDSFNVFQHFPTGGEIDIDEDDIPISALI